MPNNASPTPFRLRNLPLLLPNPLPGGRFRSSVCSMLLVKISSTCDVRVCLEHFQLKGETSPTARVPCAIDCGHIFCSTYGAFIPCPIALLKPLQLHRLFHTFNLCRSYIDSLAVRRLHIDVAPQNPGTCPTRVDYVFKERYQGSYHIYLP